MPDTSSNADDETNLPEDASMPAADADLQDELLDDIELEADEDGAADEELHVVDDPDGEAIGEDEDEA